MILACYFIEFFYGYALNQNVVCACHIEKLGGKITVHVFFYKYFVNHEVDTGVSGDVADRMGLMMKDIAQNIQVTAITHLPQVAAKGSAHFKVYKEDDEHATHTRIRRLSQEERIEELAVMLSGSKVDDAAKANAKSLLNI